MSAQDCGVTQPLFEDALNREHIRKLREKRNERKVAQAKPLCRALRWLSLKHSQFAVHFAVFELNLFERAIFYLVVALLGCLVIYGAARQIAAAAKIVEWAGNTLTTWISPPTNNSTLQSEL
ncbi:unnamed protein product [Ostreobium quekettii]|uniref:Uncharacterized protein n=1 Tax=Ostreobium quekettii TaxID=121088 RepID=A0A8S1J1R1_9CHLO|nr:unnamed protein product [Ostreobium quekettii]